LGEGRKVREAAGGRPSRDENLVDNYVLSTGTTNSDRIIARLKRDHHEIAKLSGSVAEAGTIRHGHHRPAAFCPGNPPLLVTAGLDCQ
jgi:hypothetical protein